MKIKQSIVHFISLFVLFYLIGASTLLSDTVSFSSNSKGSFPNTITNASPVFTVNMTALPVGTNIIRAQIVHKVPARVGNSTGSGTELKIEATDSPGVWLETVGPRHMWFDCTDAIKRAFSGGSPSRTASFRIVSFSGFNFNDGVRIDVWTDQNAPNSVAQVTGFTIKHRTGDTMLTFTENPVFLTGNDQIVSDWITASGNMDSTNMIRYRIYRHTSAISASNISQAELLDEIKPLTCWNPEFYSFYYSSYGTKPLPRLPVDDELLANYDTGIYVTRAKTAGNYHYYVSRSVDGEEDWGSVGSGSSNSSPQAETVGSGMVLLSKKEPYSGTQFKYVTFTNKYYYVRWECPPDYFNFPSQPADYLVVEPANSVTPRGISLVLHAWGGWCESTSNWWWEADTAGSLYVATNQIYQNWWTASHDNYRTILPSKAVQGNEGGIVRNYIEERIDSFIDDFLKTKWEINENAVIVAGGSMGGSGASMWGIREADRFAYISSWVGVHIPRETPNFLGSFEGQYGLESYDCAYEDSGMSAFDYWDTEQWLLNHIDQDIPFVAAANGKNDSGIGWPQAVKYAKALQTARQPHLYTWTQEGHGARAVMPGETHSSSVGVPMRLNQSVPAFTGCSIDEDIGDGTQETGTLVGYFNKYLLWDTSDIVDLADQWKMTVYLTADCPSENCSVTLTPRRCQNFNPPVGTICTWENRNATTNALIASGTLTVDQYARASIEDLAVTRRTTFKNRITISYTSNIYQITPSAGTGGSISPGTVQNVPEGASKTFTVIANLGYVVNRVELDGTPISPDGGSGNQYTVSNVQDDHGIAAYFTSVPVYTVSLSAGTHGSISPSGNMQVNQNGSVAFTVAADLGYEVADVTINGTSIGAVTSYTITNITSNKTVVASFQDYTGPTYSITPSAGSNGAISPSSAIQVPPGAGYLFSIQPNSGYGILDVLVNGSSVGPLSEYQFTNLQSNQTISATFVKTWTVTCTTELQGNIDPQGITTAQQGSNLTVTITPNSGYDIDYVTVNGSSVGAVSSYQLTDISSDIEVHAFYKEQVNQTVVLQQGLNGYTGATDTYIRSGYKNFGGLNEMQTYQGSFRMIIKFDISSIPSGATIEQASLQLKMKSLSNQASTKYVKIFRVTKSWVEGTSTFDGTTGVSWLYRDAEGGNAWTTAGGDYDSTIIAQKASDTLVVGEYATFDIKTVVEQWIDGVYSNYGLVIDSTDAVFLIVKAYTKEDTGGTATAPKLSITYSMPSGSTPPALTADSTANNIDNAIVITFTDDATWRSAATAVKWGATTLTAGQYSFASGTLTINQGVIQTAATQTVTVTATGYSDATVSQTVTFGAATKLVVQTQPAAPATNGAVLATQPVVKVCDQYSNTVTSSSASVATAKQDVNIWTLGGTTTVTASSGIATFTNLTATSASSVTDAQLRFSSGALAIADSSTFSIPLSLSSSVPAENWPGFEGRYHQNGSAVDLNIGTSCTVKWDRRIVPGWDFAGGTVRAGTFDGVANGAFYSRNLSAYYGYLGLVGTTYDTYTVGTGKYCHAVFLDMKTGTVKNCISTNQWWGTKWEGADALETSEGEQVVAWDPDTANFHMQVGGDQCSHRSYNPLSNMSSFVSPTPLTGVSAWNQMAGYSGFGTSRGVVACGNPQAVQQETRGISMGYGDTSRFLGLDEWDASTAGTSSYAANRSSYMEVQPGSDYLTTTNGGGHNVADGIQIANKHTGVCAHRVDQSNLVYDLGAAPISAGGTPMFKHYGSTIHQDNRIYYMGPWDTDAATTNQETQVGLRLTCIQYGNQDLQPNDGYTGEGYKETAVPSSLVFDYKFSTTAGKSWIEDDSYFTNLTWLAQGDGVWAVWKSANNGNFKLVRATSSTSTTYDLSIGGEFVIIDFQFPFNQDFAYSASANRLALYTKSNDDSTATGNFYLTVFDPSTGAERWTYNLASHFTIPRDIELAAIDFSRMTVCGKYAIVSWVDNSGTYAALKAVSIDLSANSAPSSAPAVFTYVMDGSSTAAVPTATNAKTRVRDLVPIDGVVYALIHETNEADGGHFNRSSYIAAQRVIAIAPSSRSAMTFNWSVSPNTGTGSVVAMGDASASTTTDAGGISGYQWDFDYDHITFDQEASGSLVSHTFSTVGTYNVALRLTDATHSEVMVKTVEVTASSSGSLTCENGSGIEDTFAQKSTSTWRPATNVEFQIHGASLANESCAILNFDVSSIPSGSAVDSATLQIYTFNRSGSGTFSVGSFPNDVLTVSGACWDYRNIANNAWSAATPIASASSFGTAAQPGSAGWVSFDIKSAVQAWVNGTTSNNGLGIWASATVDDRFHSVENTTDASLSPKVTISYSGATPTEAIYAVHPGSTASESYPSTSEINILWGSEGPISNVDLYYSTASATGPWTSIATSQTNDGSCPWNPAALADSPTVWIRVTKAGDTSKNAVSVNSFTIESGSNMPPTLGADTTANNIDNAIVMTFADNAAWRSAATAVKWGATPLTGGQYSFASGTLTINQGVIQTAATQAVT